MIITLDTETTGLDTKTARLIELALVTQPATSGPIDLLNRETHGQNHHWYFWPEMPIAPQSTAIHGITDDAVRDAPRFLDVVEDIAAVLRQATVIIGYNIDFDLRILRAEFERLKLEWPVSANALVIDAYRLWGKFEPRKLANAHAAFVGQPLADAHSAVADAHAARKVLDGMLFRHQNQLPLTASWEELAVFINPDGMLRFGPSNHLRWNALPGAAPDADLLLITFGKHANKPITIIASIDAGYLRWIINGASRQDKPEAKSFPEHVVEACQQALKLAPAAFTEWAKRQGGR